MEFDLGSVGVSVGPSGSNLGYGDRTLTNPTSEMAENRSRISAQGGAGFLTSHGMLKQSRSLSDAEVQIDSSKGSIGTLKLARSQSFSGGHGGSGSLLIRNDHGRLSCSPSTSDDALLPANNATPIAGEYRAICQLTYPQNPYFFKYPGMQMAMARENTNPYDAAAIVGRYPFTSVQWAELEQQALIYKYIIHGYPVPEELLLPIRKSVAALVAGLRYRASGDGWGSFNPGAGGCSVDLEPGRCRRTDGKKWRCSRPVIPEQKYCERHVHRGRHRSRKSAEAQTSSLSQPPPSPPSPASASLPARAQPSLYSSFNLVQSPHSITQKANAINIIASSAQQQTYAGGYSISREGLLHAPAPASASVTAISLNSARCSSTILALPNTHFQIPPQSLTACKDQRFVNGSSSLRAEQVVVASEAFGSPCMERHQHQLGSRQSMVPSTRINPCPSQLFKMPSLVPQKPSNNSLYPCHSLISLQAQDMQAMAMQDASPLGAFLDQQQQQEAGYFSSEDNPNQIDDVKPENQPLRHFFDDWPRSRDSSSFPCWLSETDEEKHKSKANPSSSASSTHLSISITAAPDLASATASPPRSNIFSPLKLSISRAAPDAPTDPTHMDLGMALGSNSSSHHHQSLWFPINCSMDQSNPMGGPLAEALQSSTLAAAAAKRSAGGEGGGGGLNLLDAGEGGRHDISSPRLDGSRLPSPTGVLQKTFGGCFSDNSSSASSPASCQASAQVVQPLPSLNN